MTNVRATGVCLYCGAERRYDVAQCSRCGNPWQDHRIDQLDATVLEATEPDGHERLLHDPGLGPPQRWWIPATAAAVLLGGFLLAQALTGSEEPTTTSVAAPAAPVETASPVSPATTARPASPTTAAPPTSTSSTTTVTTTTLPPIEPVGEPIATESLSLGAFALGPLRIDDPADSVVGRLVATFGQPDTVTEAGPEWGLCEGDPGRVVRFGGLAVVLSGDAGGETFAAYRLEATPGDVTASELATISGVRIGATFNDLDEAYDTSITQLIDIDGTQSFVVLRSSDRRTLLWGPMSGTDSDAVVTGIYSARPCDRGPRA